MFDNRNVFETPGNLPGLVRLNNIHHTHFSRNPKIAQFLKAYKYVKEFGEGIKHICNELETKGCAIPSFHIDAFILKATLTTEWTTEKEFNRLSTASKNDTTNVQVKIAKLTDRQREIFERIKSGTINGLVNDQVNVQVNDQVNIPNLATLFDVSEKTIGHDLYVLRDKNLILYVGSDKTGHWEVK